MVVWHANGYFKTERCKSRGPCHHYQVSHKTFTTTLLSTTFDFRCQRLNLPSALVAVKCSQKCVSVVSCSVAQGVCHSKTRVEQQIKSHLYKKFMRSLARCFALVMSLKHGFGILCLILLLFFRTQGGENPCFQIQEGILRILHKLSDGESSVSRQNSRKY